jgi:hypothetical protein
MKKLLILLTCIIGIGTVAPTPAQAWDGCRPRVPVYRNSYGYPVYRQRYYEDNGYRSYPVRYRYNENRCRDDGYYYQPRCHSYRPRFGFSFLFTP